MLTIIPPRQRRTITAAQWLLQSSGTHRHLVPIGDLDATQATPLTDAGLTPYHAIAGLTEKLDEDSAVAVVGVGGLGHLAVQLLRALTPSRVVAVDTREDALELAHSCGAHVGVLTRADMAGVLRGKTGGTGFDAVLDFVGNDATLALGAATLRAGGTLVVLGSGAGRLTTAKPGPLPQGATVTLPFWGTRLELHAVVELARAGKLSVATEVQPLTEAVRAFDDLRSGRVLGRVVLVPVTVTRRKNRRARTTRTSCGRHQRTTRHADDVCGPTPGTNYGS